MSKQKQEWLNELVKNYSIPTEEKTNKRGVLNETQLKNLKIKEFKNWFKKTREYRFWHLYSMQKRN